MLQRWANKTLLERVALIEKEFDVKVTFYKLRIFYLKHGVKFRNTQMVYRNHLVNKIGLDRERYHFIRSILEPIMRGEPYVYMDEMSLNSFMTKKKAWSLEETPVVTAVNSGPRLKQTVYGSIGNIFKTAILDYR